mmetsp:Transcript_9186/g.21826  ORF Transcript_9186/g.21826 Transcript_9186/m.21826 type:complete len:564 (-) Transcript_9186:26-1717(-)
MMETCASVCTSSDAAGIDTGRPNVAGLLQQYSLSDKHGHNLSFDVGDLSKALASVVQAEQSLLQSKTVLAQVVQQLQRSSKPQLPKSSDEAEVRIAAEGEDSQQVVPTVAEPGFAEARQESDQAPASIARTPTFPSEIAMVATGSKEFSVPTQSLQLKRAKTGQTLLSMAEEEIPAVSAGLWPFLQAISRKLVGSLAFEFAILAVIIINSFIIGLESQMSLNQEALDWAPLGENFFLAVYSLEILARLAARRSGTPCDGWFAFDALLVLSSYLERIIELISGESAEQLMLLRLLRLFRLVRTFRMVKQVRPLWRLVHGLMTSLDTVLSTFLLLALVLYVFGVLGVELIATSDSFKSDPVTNAILESNFSSLGYTMITLAQFVTLDSVAAVYFPLVRVQPWLMLYFAFLIAIVSISVMNLVTAALVEGTLENARMLRQEEERMRSANTQQMLPEILELFDRADEDGSGELAIDEMRRFEEAGHVPEQILDRASVSSMTELFNVLDVDKSGVVTREEFAEGLLDILLRDVSVSALQQMKILRTLRDGLGRLEETIAGLKAETSSL